MKKIMKKIEEEIQSYISLCTQCVSEGDLVTPKVYRGVIMGLKISLNMLKNK